MPGPRFPRVRQRHKIQGPKSQAGCSTLQYLEFSLPVRSEGLWGEGCSSYQLTLSLSLIEFKALKENIWLVYLITINPLVQNFCTRLPYRLLWGACRLAALMTNVHL